MARWQGILSVFICGRIGCAEATPAQPPKLLEILDDALAIRIPLAADYADNFVTGMMAQQTALPECRSVPWYSHLFHVIARASIHHSAVKYQGRYLVDTLNMHG